MTYQAAVPAVVLAEEERKGTFALGAILHSSIRLPVRCRLAGARNVSSNSGHRSEIRFNKNVPKSPPCHALMPHPPTHLSFRAPHRYRNDASWSNAFFLCFSPVFFKLTQWFPTPTPLFLSNWYKKTPPLFLNRLRSFREGRECSGFGGGATDQGACTRTSTHGTR